MKYSGFIPQGLCKPNIIIHLEREPQFFIFREIRDTSIRCKFSVNKYKINK